MMMNERPGFLPIDKASELGFSGTYVVTRIDNNSQVNAQRNMVMNHLSTLVPNFYDQVVIPEAHLTLGYMPTGADFDETVAGVTKLSNKFRTSFVAIGVQCYPETPLPFLDVRVTRSYRRARSLLAKVLPGFQEEDKPHISLFYLVQNQYNDFMTVIPDAVKNMDFRPALFRIQDLEVVSFSDDGSQRISAPIKVWANYLEATM